MHLYALYGLKKLFLQNNTTNYVQTITSPDSFLV